MIRKIFRHFFVCELGKSGAFLNAASSASFPFLEIIKRYAGLPTTAAYVSHGRSIVDVHIQELAVVFGEVRIDINMGQLECGCTFLTSASHASFPNAKIAVCDF